MAHQDEQIVERLIERGTPERAGREIQLRNLPTLRSSVLTSQATQAEQLRRQRANLTGQVAQQRTGIISQLANLRDVSLRRTGTPAAGTQAATSGLPPLGTVSRNVTGQFELTVPSGSGAGVQSRTFKTIDDLVKFIQNTPALQGRIVAGGVNILERGEGRAGFDPSGQQGVLDALSQSELDTLAKAGVTPGTRAQARQAGGRSAQPAGIFRSFIQGVKDPSIASETALRREEEGQIAISERQRRNDRFLAEEVAAAGAPGRRAVAQRGILRTISRTL